MRELLFVFLGGGIGSCCRFVLSKWLNQIFHSFPLGTFTANILSCIVLGAALFLFEHKFPMNTYLKTLILVGFCGGFSTFSTFTNETLLLLRNGQITESILYMGGSLVLGLSALLAGFFLGKMILN